MIKATVWLIAGGLSADAHFANGHFIAALNSMFAAITHVSW
jgi:hypothetical protein